MECKTGEKEIPMRQLKKWIMWIIPIAVAGAMPACNCGANVGPVHAGAGASVAN